MSYLAFWIRLLGFRRKTWPIQGVGKVIHLNNGGISKEDQCWLMVIPQYNISIVISTCLCTDQFFDFANIYVDLLEMFIPAAQTASN